MKRFKLLPKVGNHTQRDKAGELVTITAEGGEIIETEDDLCKMFPGKFEEVKIPESQAKKEKTEDTKSKPKKKIVKKKKKSLGRDVTEKFEVAEEEDFKVFYATGRGYFVAEAEDPTTSLNEKGLKKASVEKYIKKYLKE